MLTTEKTNKNMSKYLYYFICGGLTMLVCSIAYIYYVPPSSCRVLKNMSSDEEINNMLKLELMNYLKIPQVQSDLEKTAGEVFSVNEFSVPISFSTIFSSLGVSDNKLQLVIKSSRGDKRFTEPFRIEEIGVGYSRAYLMFKNNGSSELSNDNFFLELKSESYVDCRT